MFRILTALFVAVGLCVVPMGCGGDDDIDLEELGHDPDYEFQEVEPPERDPDAPLGLTPGPQRN